jgi:hypothetical protein
MRGNDGLWGRCCRKQMWGPTSAAIPGLDVVVQRPTPTFGANLGIQQILLSHF